ncbi:TrbC/VirB2 family protein [Altererythrobacter sp. Root672]|uniref:TrbC/VirB2 family protein n=1 Tax=Altererythrobacter sp. Root672 TaxID=1736584 RepID=UPI000700A5E8|nr:TrbC/VirB2 family protein [Altererythrobacter sp. Root672]KRA81512.1 hypothetical protein ASD76_13295 [Altererythrobacter sp. Root672]
MNRLLPLAASSFVALAASIAVLPVPAAAQDEAGDKVNTVIIYGDDECPPSVDGEIVVCARLDESERFRIPRPLRESNSPANQAWSQRVRSYETVGSFGPMSCSPVGGGGQTGCTAQFIEAAYAAKREGTDVRFSQLIAEQRDERLATIDAEAADTQARVEQAEQEYMERQRQQQDAEGTPVPQAAPTSAPRTVDPLAIPPSP